MDSKIISISMPVPMLRKVDEAAAMSYQSRSNFIRMCVVEKFGAQAQYDPHVFPENPILYTDRQLADMYDVTEEYEEYIEASKEDKNNSG